MSYTENPLPPIPPPPPASTPPAPRRPWIIATTAVSVVALAAVVVAVVAVAGANSSATITEATGKIKEKAEAAEDKAAAGYQIREGVCADIDPDAALGDWAKPDGDLREQVVELGGLECRAYGKEFEDGSITILVATHPDAEAAGKAVERRKGEIYGATWSDVDGTDWDQAQFANSDIGAPALLVQDANLDVAVEVSASEKKSDDFKGDEAQKVLTELAEAAVKAVEDKDK